MIHLILPDEALSHKRPLPFFLAMEEWVAATLPADEYFFTWSSDPTVIIGRNQDLDTEVDRDYCESKGIAIVRRRSGGGCVYADRDNLMLSYISPCIDVMGTFARYTGRVCRALKSMGLDAEVSGRNDITIGNRKISGTAFYHVPGHSIVHGTMLYDTDLSNMMNAITPARAKLESNGVKSVGSRITTVRNLLPELSLDRFEKGLINNITDSTRTLDMDDVREIERLEERYYAQGWLEGHRKCPTIRVDGVGDIAINTCLTDAGTFESFELSGDAFVIKDLGVLLDAVKGATPDYQHLTHALQNLKVSDFIAGLSNETFIKLLISAATN